MHILRKNLKALLFFAAKNDIRFYLCGIQIKGEFMVATDGYRLAVCHLPADSGLDIIIGRDDIETALKIDPKNETIEITENTLGRLSYKPIDGKFPEWKNVIPEKGDTTKSSPISMNPKYLADFFAVSKILTGKDWDGIQIWQREDHVPAVVTIQSADDFFFVVMTMRIDGHVVFPCWLPNKATAS